jgi:outer membrane protein assembly factor BamB
LVGNVWDFKQGKIGMGLGNTLLVKVDTEGKVVKQKTFPGRIAAAARLRDGNIAVVDDPQSYAGEAGVGAPTFQDNAVYAKSFMRLQSWTPDLALSWSVRLPEFHVQFLPLSIAAAPQGGVVILGSGRGFQFIASEYDAQGRLVWTSTDSTRTWGISSLGGSGGLFAVAHLVYEPDMRVALSQFTLK